MSEEVMLNVSPEISGIRADKFISDNTDLTRSAVQNLMNDSIFIDGKTVNKNYKLKGGEEIKIISPEPQNMDTVPENIPLDIIYEDNDLLVVNKPKGMVVHPAHGNYSGTLVNALLYHCGETFQG